MHPTQMKNREFYEQTGDEPPGTMTVKVKGQLIQKDNSIKDT